MVVVNKTAKPTRSGSGRNLYGLLCVGLSGVALATDISANRISQPALSVIAPLAVSALLVTLLGFGAVPLLRSLKTGQVIQEDGPQSHLKKAGTPTMGGIFFIPVALALSVAWVTLATDTNSVNVIAATLLTFCLGFVGWVDDWQVLRKKSNKGMSARLRLGIELGSGLIFGLWLFLTRPEIQSLALPFGLALPLGVLFLAVSTFVVAAESNAVNLTDGMDGLAAGTSAIAFLGMALVVAPQSPELMIFCACLSGSCLGFLAHNHNPAQVFMGDTGSLALGGALAAVGLITNTLWALLILSGLFLVESLSVIAQVTYYKATKGPDGVGKRLFKMSPIHHHFEQSGWPEVRVVSTFYACVAALAIVACGLNALS
ncbi:phospho-N-acetylmuramoyl-pentapeptide-transferase [Acaryochloris sp. IP29b_bin.148]|uniref:phospho-N-acetylmuramoyl-pentapeptide- transferase n=1 Tax=Acaryochloris sp. IP29b_bin.148 TaxID=2969218 RepID=UPI00261DBDD9|nr:phospho-N-acetylmuramoyl-pentapeptide-transferase [Acaryochloris sp. IP29b_bin.148]